MAPKVLEPEAPTKTGKPGVKPEVRKMSVPEAVEDAFLQRLYKILLHNDDRNSMDHVVKALMHVFGFDLAKAGEVMREAHTTGVALCTVCRQEVAELRVEQLQGYGLVATMEPE